MPKRKKAEDYALIGIKDCWHPYGLQVLTPDKFAVVVGKIMRGQHSLIRPRIQNKPTLH